MARPKASSRKTSQGEHDEASAEYQRGMDEIRKQLGPMADSYIQKIKALAPEFAWVNVTFPFGELYTRDVLDLKTRELCTVAALTVQGFSLPQLKMHIDAALRCGSLARRGGRGHHPDDRLCRLPGGDQRADDRSGGLPGPRRNGAEAKKAAK